MKKILIVLVILFLIIGLGVGGFVLLRGRQSETDLVPTPTPEVFVKTTLNERPFISLTPSSDGHWLTLALGRIQDADSLEFELTYNTDDGLTQGAVGGPYKLKGETSYEKKILLGTESSGNYRYHEGVEEGSVTIRLAGGVGARKFITEFKLYQGEEEITSPDGGFALEGDLNTNQYYLVMDVIGLPEVLAEVDNGKVYGIFSSDRSGVKNGVITVSEGDVFYHWTGNGWTEVQDGQVAEIGVFALPKPN